MRLKTLRRRNADFVHQSEEILANKILVNHGSDIITEEMRYKALQKRSAETKVSEKTGKYVSKKRFGKSLSKHAPARFRQALERKLGYMGKAINYVDTASFRASQYDHVSDTYEKMSLSSRSKYIGGHHVQRDLYSAFLLMCARGPDKPDRNICDKAFPDFIINMNAAIISLLTSNKRYPSSLGLNDFRHLVTT